MPAGRKKGQQVKYKEYTTRKCRVLLKETLQERIRIAYNFIHHLSRENVNPKDNIYRVKLITHYLAHYKLVPPEYLWKMIKIAQDNLNNPNVDLSDRVNLIIALDRPVFAQKIKAKKDREEDKKIFEERLQEWLKPLE